MIVNGSSSISANTAAPYAALGRQPVGQENNDLKSSSLKALEQSAASARNGKRRSHTDKLDPPIQINHQVREGECGKGEQEHHQSNSTQHERIKDQEEINALKRSEQNTQVREQTHASEGGQHGNVPVYEIVKNRVGANLETGIIKKAVAVSYFLNHRA